MRLKKTLKTLQMRNLPMLIASSSNVFVIGFVDYSILILIQILITSKNMVILIKLVPMDD